MSAWMENYESDDRDTMHIPSKHVHGSYKHAIIRAHAMLSCNTSLNTLSAPNKMW